MNYSITQAGNLATFVGLLAMVLKYFGLEVAESEIEALVASLITVVGLCISWYGRYRKGDITILGFRK